MRIQHNIMAMNAYRNYNANTSALSKNLEKLSSGYKINRAGDDAAGLAISEKMRAQITGLNAAQKNVKDGISLVKTAEGAMQEIQDMLNRMDYLATQSANGTYDNEVDRYNLQKEVNQLKSEINRIADSANFNGIKLLDGKAGVNTSAFSFENVEAIQENDGSIKDFVAKETDGTPKVHTEDAAVTAAAPSATIDLGDFAVTGNKAGDKVTITIAGKDYELTSATDNDLDSAAKIATALKAAIAASNDGVKPADGTHSGTAADNTAIRIGNAAYTVGGTGSTITLTYAGRYDSATGTTFTAETAYTGTAGQASAINGELGFDVSVKSVTTTDGTRAGDVIHKATNVEQAKAEVVASKAGIDIDLSKGMVVDGGMLEIDGKKFVFQTEATQSDAVKAAVAAGAKAINVSAAKTDEERIHMAADLLSKKAQFTGQDSRTWKIGVNGDGTTIHIDQTTASDGGSELNTYDKLVGVVKASGAKASAAAAGVAINVVPDKVAAGNKLVIDGKTYTFVDGATNAAKNEISKDDAVAGLQTVLGTDYSVTVDGNKVTVRGKTATASAPVIEGTGLTLQIGDTSDSYNRLDVKIGDMHVSAMGDAATGKTIQDVDISNPEGASAAINTIKAAINYVSGIRGDLGATQNRLEHTANNLSVMAENIQDAESTIRDTDVAEEMMAYTKNNILIQSAQAMLAQANAVPQGVLQLLG